MVTLGGNVRSESELQGIKKGPAGWYLALLDSEDESKVDQTGKFDLDFQLIAGTNPAGIGCTHQERLDINSDFGQKRATKLALALGLMAVQQLGTNVDVSFANGIGRACLIRIKDHSYSKKEFDDQGNPVLGPDGKQSERTIETTQIDGLEMHSINSKEAAKYPFVAQKMNEMAGGGTPQQASPQQAAPQQAAAQQAAWPVNGAQGPGVTPGAQDWSSVASDF